MWERIIEFPDHGLMVREIAEILKACLSEHELEQLCEELLGWPSNGYEVLDEFDLTC